MVEFLANVASFATPVCMLIAFIWAVAIRKPHDMEEKHNREMLQNQLQSFTEGMKRLEKKAFETIQELKDAIKDLTLQIRIIDKSKEKFEVRLENFEKRLDKDEEELHTLELRYWSGRDEENH